MEISADKFHQGQYSSTILLPSLDGYYQISFFAESDNNSKLIQRKYFQRECYPWEGTPLGKSNKVYSPFTPIKVEGNFLSTVLRKHTLNNWGLIDQIEATSANTGISKPILAEPMRFHASVEGKSYIAEVTEPLTFISVKPHEVKTRSSFALGELNIKTQTVWEYDGAAKVELNLMPAKSKIDAFILEIPFSSDPPLMIHANADRIRTPIAQTLPKKNGVLWTAAEVPTDDIPQGFCPYIYLGGPIRGLCWCDLSQ